MENGYKIPFFTTSVSNFFQNNQSVFQNENFVTRIKKESSRSDRIKEIRTPPYIENPPTFAKNSHSKPRLILDLGYVSSCVYKDRIKFEQ